jgi:rhodanese-related sulfurtransferase
MMRRDRRRPIDPGPVICSHGFAARQPPRLTAACRYAHCMSAAPEDSGIELDPERVAEWLEQDPALQLIDVRESYERDAGHIEGTRHIALNELSNAAGTFERGRPVVFYCRVGSRSAMAAQALRASGFEAYSMQGGLVRWAQEGRGLSPAGGYVADH